AVYIEDGGANDDDGVVNGIIVDPLGVRRGAPAAVGVGGGSGAFNPLALMMLLLLLLLALPARRAAARRTRQRANDAADNGL
ncbi:MAG: hypothetical protein OXU34_03735, partial [Gammaproteobacteria bacterium]|nr:hypothetical protein [Gammaproteobacteria bacterium]